MDLKAMVRVMLAGLVVFAAGCGNQANPQVATAVRYASDGTLVVFGGSVIDGYGPDLTGKKFHLLVDPCVGAVFGLSADGSVAAVGCSTLGEWVQLIALSSDRASR